MTMTATLPGGKDLVLMDIQDWDLDWQDRYHFKQPIDLPAGTVLVSRLVYDNSAGNPENPFNPPRRVQWGRESTDEMGSITLTVVPRDKDDDSALAAAQRRHLVASATKAVEEARKTILQVGNYDENRDGLIQFEEVPPNARARIFGRFDKNGNKVLETDEQTALQEYLDTLGGLGNRLRDRLNR
jgi:hypothetical protein